ncbi:Uncharacterised protein [Mycobacteroides abscessus subsp. abscessus]|nr:Uncharacterised protein [Mycobacteroides abscessus subsp. abscessus]
MVTSAPKRVTPWPLACSSRACWVAPTRSVAAAETTPRSLCWATSAFLKSSSTISAASAAECGR